MKLRLFIFSILIFFTSLTYGMQTNSPTDKQNYETLKTIFHDIDAKSFIITDKSMDTSVLTRENIEELTQGFLQLKAAIMEEIEAMGNQNVNGYKMAKGALTTTLSASVLVFAMFVFKESITSPFDHISAEAMRQYNAERAMAYQFLNDGTRDSSAFRGALAGADARLQRNLSAQRRCDNREKAALILALSIAGGKIFSYGYEDVKIGWNYKQYLLDIIKNIDAISTHIAQANTFQNTKSK